MLESPNWDMRRLTGPSPDGKYVYYSKGQESAPDGHETVRLVRRDLETGTESELYRAEFARPASSARRSHPTDRDWHLWRSTREGSGA